MIILFEYRLFPLLLSVAAISCIDEFDKNEVTVIQEERSGHFHLWLLPRYDWMTDKFGNSLSSIREIMNYSKENFKTKDNIEEVLFVVSKLKVVLLSDK